MNTEFTQLELRVAALEKRSIKKEVIKKVRMQDASTQTDPTEEVLPVVNYGDEDIILIN